MDLAALEQRVAALEQMLHTMQYGASFWRVGADIGNPALTAITVCLADDDYNGETLVEGDVLLGDNSSGFVNLLWDATNGLKVRTQTTPIITLGVNGFQNERSFGNAQVSLDVSGIPNVDLDNGLGAELLTSFIRIDAANAAFTIDSILIAEVLGQRLLLLNNTAQTMTVRDNVAGPPAGYAVIRTLDPAPDVVCNFCEFVYNDFNSKWMLSWFT